jgi:flagellar basal body-associated protein FliL
VQTAIQFTSQAADACKTGGKTEFADEISNKLQSYYTKYVKIVQPGGR